MPTGMGRKIIRDPIHGNISLPSYFFDLVIDDPLFQRLKYIKQLGLTYYVFPGGTHSRMIHSIGVSHNSGEMTLKLVKNTRDYVINNDIFRRFHGKRITLLEKILEKLSGDEAREAVMMAGLLHDVGHIAYSHLSEDAPKDLQFIAMAANTAIPTETITKSIGMGMKMHEMLTLEIVENYFCKKLERGRDRLCSRDVFGDGLDGLDRVARVFLLSKEILKAAYEEGYCRELLTRYGCLGSCDSVASSEKCASVLSTCILSLVVNNAVDADRLDFMVRDSYCVGKPGEVVDIQRILDTLVIVPVPESQASYECQYALGVVDKGFASIEQMLLSRLYLYKDVYLHKVSLAYEAITTRFISLLLGVSVNLPPDKLEDTLSDKRTRSIIGCLQKILLPISDGEENGYRFRCVTSLVDPRMDLLAQEIAEGEQDDLLNAVMNLAGNSQPSVGRKLCVSLYMAALAIAERKHWPFIFVDAGSRTQIGSETLVKALRGPLLSGEYLSSVAVRKYVEVAASSIVAMAEYSAYKFRRRENERRLWVLLRKTGRVVPMSYENLRSLIHVPVITLGVVEDRKYGKILFLNPAMEAIRSQDSELQNQFKGLPYNRGKIVVADLERATERCKYRSVEKLIQNYRDDVEKLVGLAGYFR